MNDSPTDAYRYAIYFAPAPGSPQWEAGSRWLGRCAAQQQALPQPGIAGVAADEFQRLTAAPRRYGWHATLKAPFALAPGVDVAALRSAVRRLCQSLRPFAMPPLRVARLDDFLALVPGDDAAGQAAIDAVARACVIGLAPLGAPLGPAELQRRRAGGLTAEEDALLLRWGYPYVLERFRFHLSLTGSLRGVDASTVQALQDAARRWFDPLPACCFGTVALFAEPAPGADFVLVDHQELGA